MSYIKRRIEKNRAENPAYRVAFDEETERYTALQEQRRQLMHQFATARKSLKLSQKDIGDKLNVSQARVSQMERGEAAMSFDRVIELASILGLNLTLTSEETASSGRS